MKLISRNLYFGTALVLLSACGGGGGGDGNTPSSTQPDFIGLVQQTANTRAEDTEPFSTQDITASMSNTDEPLDL